MAHFPVIYNRTLLDWLSRFAESMDRSRFKRGRFLCGNGYVWDYHAASGRIHASVEDHRSDFFQVDILWEPDQQMDGTKNPLPKLNSMKFRCSCENSQMPCEHVAAVMIYRIVDLDRRNRERKSPVDHDMISQQLLDKFRKQIHEKPPTFHSFNSSMLRTRPDFHEKINVLAGQAMEGIKKMNEIKSDK